LGVVKPRCSKWLLTTWESMGHLSVKLIYPLPLPGYARRVCPGKDSAVMSRGALNISSDGSPVALGSTGPHEAWGKQMSPGQGPTQAIELGVFKSTLKFHDLGSANFLPPLLSLDSLPCSTLYRCILSRQPMLLALPSLPSLP